MITRNAIHDHVQRPVTEAQSAGRMMLWGAVWGLLGWTVVFLAASALRAVTGF